MKKLKPCPFCGQRETNNATLRFEENYGNGTPEDYWCFISCGKCLTEGPASKSHSAAARKWNKRMPIC